MDDVVIKVENLSKQYNLGVIGHGTLSQDLQSKWARFRGKEDPNSKVDLYNAGSGSDLNERFWALRNVSFEVHRGEILGIIGRNGAGKSTLLKILSRVTAPTEGTVKVKGRIASLLEVGTGFHPELTGRENVYLNGSILGMTRREIEEKFDEIVRFAEIERFIDTPVKRYSSGMYVRLAFAVAAHLEPDILVVDEVLAVGDAAFQKKSLGKMKDVSSKGRTVLFVSHNMGVMTQLCERILWFEEGKIKKEGDNVSIISEYIRSTVKSEKSPVSHYEEDLKKEAQLLEASIKNTKGEVTSAFSCDEPVIVSFLFRVRKNVPGLYGYFAVRKDDGTIVMQSDSFDTPPNPFDELSVGDHVITVTIPARTLAPGDYSVYLNFTSDRASQWNVDSPGIVGYFSLSDYSSKRGDKRGGYFSTMLEWNVNAN